MPRTPVALLLSVPCLLLAPLAAQAAATAPAQSPARDPFAASRLARAGRFAMLLRQFRGDEPTLPDHHEAGWKPATAVHGRERDLPAGFWVWQRPYWFVFRDGPDTVGTKDSWGPEAACGEPDTPEPGDHGTAWASLEQDAGGEWLLLEYGTPVRATAIEIHETCHPGAVSAIAIFTPQGERIELWANRDVKPTAEKGRVLQLDLPLGFEVERVELVLASEAVPGWNEIDAVGLRDDKGKVHWAKAAAASSTFARKDAAAPVVLGGIRPVVVLPAVQPVRVQVDLPRFVVQARAVGAPQFAPAVAPRADGADAEKDALRRRVAELEARVAELEAELAKARARR